MLQSILKSKVTQAELARKLGISPTSVWRLLKMHQLPQNGRAAVLEKLRGIMRSLGIPDDDISRAMATLDHQQTDNTTDEKKDDIMALRHHTLSQQARQAFGIFRDPFAQPEQPDDVYLSPSIRYAREALYQAATHGNFMALVGESGSGKSTLRRELIERLNRDNGDVIVIQPYVLTMAQTDNGAGKPLRTSHIIESILHALDPSTSTSSSPEVLARRVHEARSGPAAPETGTASSSKRRTTCTPRRSKP